MKTKTKKSIIHNSLGFILGLALVAICILFFDRHLRQSISKFARPVPAYPVWIDRLEKEKPEILFIGNSILDGGLDEQRLAKDINKKVSKVANGGTHTAWWMLYIKNVLLKATHKPKYLVVLFRRNLLTVPELRVKGRYYYNLAPMMTKNESLLNELAYKVSLSPIEFFLYKNSFIFRERELIKKGIDDWVKEKISLLFSNNKELANIEIKKAFATSRFDRDRLRSTQDKEETVAKNKQYDFNHSVKTSFLPHMLEMLKKVNVKPIFIASKMRGSAKTHTENRVYHKYFIELEKYFKERDIPFFALAEDTRLQEKHYSDGDHFNELGSAILTTIIQEKIEKVFLSKNN